MIPPEGQRVPGFQHAARDFQKGQPNALRIPGNFIDPGAEGGPDGAAGIIDGQKIQQLADALVAEGGAEKAGEKLPLPHQRVQPVGRNIALPEIGIQGFLVAQGGLFRIEGGKGHDAVGKQGAQGRKQFIPAAVKTVRLVHKKHHGHAAFLHQMPQRAGMRLNAVRRADDEHSQIHNAQRALRFARKVRMPGSVHEREGGFVPGQPGFLGKDGDAPLLFQRLGVQKCVAVVHPSLTAYGAGKKQHGFGQGGFAGVHMGRQTDHGALAHADSPFRQLFSQTADGDQYNTGSGDFQPPVPEETHAECPGAAAR